MPKRAAIVLSSRANEMPKKTVVKDIRRVEGDPQVGNDDKLLRVLAHRSLAFEFIHDQARNGSQSKIDYLCHYVISTNPETDISQKGSRSEVSDFIRRHTRFTSKALARRAVHSGVEYLVFEKFLKHRLQQIGLPDTCESISAILGLHINQFKTLRYNQMPAIVDALLLDDVQITLKADGNREEGVTRHVLDVLRDLTPWFENLQAAYKDE